MNYYNESELKSLIKESPERSNYKQAVWDGKLVCRFLEEKKKMSVYEKFVLK